MLTHTSFIHTRTGQMQLNYEHCLPMKQDDVNAKRTAIIFRHGSTVPVSLDTGIPLINEGTEEVNPIHTTDSGNNATSSHFGHIGGEIREGKKLYSRSTLKRLAAHRYAMSMYFFFVTLVYIFSQYFIPFAIVDMIKKPSAEVSAMDVKVYWLNLR